MVESVSIIATCVANITILNIYKPPNDNWPNPVLPATVHPSLLASDFNSHHTNWGYYANDKNGEKLSDWLDTEDLQLIFNDKDRCTFHSGRWNYGYNPDLCSHKRQNWDSIGNT